MSAPHGKKRAANSSLDGEQRLSKRFNLLNLGIAARLYIPVPSSTDAAAAAATPPAATPHPLAPNAPAPRRQRAPRPPANDDSMHVEDTAHRVYIHDLAAELSDTDSDSENPIFLSDIEKHLSKIPRHVLLGPPPGSAEHKQVVLYSVPASLSVPEEQDNVRKAIVEARQRMRERQAGGVAEPERVPERSGRASTALAEREEEEAREEDADAMDLD
ncbi:hypothetical protein BU25DRAFT_392480 [Macroventuria anomochaeta]|uniref:Uncharacterized protein n=1 Tax=Macroventuria anomochaeta TaxID=301207 RepID=A0ACB6S4A8_9PLEO|nr:uncharacterized protein BU25DRAFT_392480 [Macroventuria anomochaeta]KAF2627967.1 hypothetical protein BU25DRAFT_392480 [Macroventuria anomochaeta]